MAQNAVNSKAVFVLVSKDQDDECNNWLQMGNLTNTDYKQTLSTNISTVDQLIQKILEFFSDEKTSPLLNDLLPGGKTTLDTTFYVEDKKYGEHITLHMVGLNKTLWGTIVTCVQESNLGVRLVAYFVHPLTAKLTAVPKVFKKVRRKVLKYIKGHLPAIRNASELFCTEESKGRDWNDLLYRK